MVKNRIFQVCLGMIFMMLFSGVAGAADGKGIPHIEVDYLPFTLEELILDASSLIIIGRVEGIGEVTHPDLVSPSDVFRLMEVRVSVSRRIKGQCPEEITLITDQQDTTIVIINPPPHRFTIGEEVLLIIFPAKEEYYGISHKGKYTLLDGRIAGSDVLLEDFIRQIRELLAGERSEITLELPTIWSLLEQLQDPTSVGQVSWGQVKVNFK